jgi:cytochrome c oxidase assembly protein subunit 15
MTLRAYTAFLAAFTFLLVIAGGLVTSTGSALAVPDWPLSFGKVFPKMEGGVFYEHGHRMIAATVGFLTIILAIWLWRAAQEPLLKMAGWIALGLVCAQGILGGITVLLKLPAVASVGHACLGQIFFSWICCIAAMAWSSSFPAVSGRESMDPPSKPTGDDVKRLRRLALMTTGFVLFQLLFGAIYRHTGMLLHMHFLGAVLVFVHILLLSKRIRNTIPSDLWLSRPASLLVGLLFVQIGLGVYTWQRPDVPNATAHVAVGALILAISSVISLESFRRVQV